MAVTQRKSGAKAGGVLEGALAILIALFVASQFDLLKQRALKQGAARYRTDLAREVAPFKSYGPRDLASRLCEDAGSLIGAACGGRGIPPGALGRIKSMVRGTLAAMRARLLTRPAREPSPEILARHFARIDRRYQAFLDNFERTLAGLETSTRLQSEAYRPAAMDKLARKSRPGWGGWWSRALGWLGSVLPPDSFLRGGLSPSPPLTAEEQRLRAIALQAFEHNRTLNQARDELHDFYALTKSPQPKSTNLSEYYLAAEKAYRDNLDRGDPAEAARLLHRIGSVLDGRSPDGASAAERTAARTAERLLMSPIHAGKARSILTVYQRAGPAFVAWTLLLLLLIAMGRRRADPLRLTALALIAWAAAGWLSAAPIPSLGFAVTAGAGAVLWFLRSALGVIAARVGMPGLMPIRQRAASAWLLPAWLLLIGTGWLIMADLALTFHHQNRFLALQQYTTVFIALAMLAIIPLWRVQLLASITGFFGWITGFLHGGGAAWTRAMRCGLVALTGIVAVLVASIWLDRRQYLSGELFKLAVLFAGAWLMVHRADALYQCCRWGFFRLGWPIAAVLGIIALGFVITRDLGPLLVTGLTLTTVFGAYIGFGRTLALMAVLVAGLFLFGDLHSVVAGRLESLRDPFSSGNEHLARLLWFQHEAPVSGFGIGNAPWCGFAFGGGCPGLPKQLQSDYTFTALIGAYGTAAWGFVALIVLMVLGLQRAHVQPGGLGFVPGDATGLRNAYLSWIAVLFGGMLFFQLLITVAGNLGRFPVTGITFPFVSFGDAATLAGTFLLALLLNRPAEHRS